MRPCLPLSVVSLIVALSFGATATTALARPLDPVRGSAAHPFPRANWLYRPIVTTPALRGDSAVIAKQLAASGVNRTASTYAYGARIYTATAGTPHVPITVNNAGTSDGKWGNNVLQTQVIPIPRGAAPAVGSDGKLAIIDLDRRLVFDLFRASFDGKRWTADWGGVYPLDGNGVSVRPSYQNGVPWPLPVSRATGSGLSTIAGVITMADIRSGSIDHALVFGTDIGCGPANSGPFQWPATTTDGYVTGRTCIPQGSRIQLDPAIDLAAVPGISAGELMIGRALQRYGAYCVDNAGARIAVQFETPPDGTESPYPGVGITSDQFPLKKLPWGSLRVLSDWDG